MNHADERIKKMFNQGLPLATIARKLGRPGDTQRVLDGLKRAGIKVEGHAVTGHPDGWDGGNHGS